MTLGATNLEIQTRLRAAYASSRHLFLPICQALGEVPGLRRGQCAGLELLKHPEDSGRLQQKVTSGASQGKEYGMRKREEEFPAQGIGRRGHQIQEVSSRGRGIRQGPALTRSFKIQISPADFAQMLPNQPPPQPTTASCEIPCSES